MNTIFPTIKPPKKYRQRGDAFGSLLNTGIDRADARSNPVRYTTFVDSLGPNCLHGTISSFVCDSGCWLIRLFLYVPWSHFFLFARKLLQNVFYILVTESWLSQGKFVSIAV